MSKLLLMMIVAGFVALSGATIARAQDKPAAGTMGDQLDAAMKAIEQAKAAVAADKKQEALDRLAEAAKVLTQLKQALAAAPVGELGTFIGTVEATASQKRPRLVVAGTHYELKPSDKAEPTVKDTLAKISTGEATGEYVAKGTESTIDGRKWILVDSIAKK